MKIDFYKQGIARRVMGLVLFLAFPFLLLGDLLSPILNALYEMIKSLRCCGFNPVKEFKSTYNISKDGFLIFIGKKK